MWSNVCRQHAADSFALVLLVQSVVGPDIAPCCLFEPLASLKSAYLPVDLLLNLFQRSSYIASAPGWLKFTPEPTGTLLLLPVQMANV